MPVNKLPNFSGKAFLAPMAGITDPAMRLLCKQMGAALVATELTSIHSIIAQSAKKRLREFLLHFLAQRSDSSLPCLNILAYCSRMQGYHLDSSSCAIGAISKNNFRLACVTPARIFNVTGISTASTKVRSMFLVRFSSCKRAPPAICCVM